jgi:hypothetical protein
MGASNNGNSGSDIFPIETIMMNGRN